MINDFCNPAADHITILTPEIDQGCAIIFLGKRASAVCQAFAGTTGSHRWVGIFVGHMAHPVSLHAVAGDAAPGARASDAGCAMHSRLLNQPIK